MLSSFSDIISLLKRDNISAAVLWSECLAHEAQIGKNCAQIFEICAEARIGANLPKVGPSGASLLLNQGKALLVAWFGFLAQAG